ncbi:hypothetical protein FOZ63_029964 [Perkinsus olseni]|uniref:Uncharacterized protein n=1 Tax=Perkinsus olseni TaxID=32597 RepID=A0A7J6PXE6_PEROL|nr:hypothetical protein FOZ63_029964 [Perkinsus olseni]KAF4734451.1 hypothetical protein FOZ62_031787 [Perkinsus olseni]
MTLDELPASREAASSSRKASQASVGAPGLSESKSEKADMLEGLAKKVAGMAAVFTEANAAREKEREALREKHLNVLMCIEETKKDVIAEASRLRSTIESYEAKTDYELKRLDEELKTLLEAKHTEAMGRIEELERRATEVESALAAEIEERKRHTDSVLGMLQRQVEEISKSVETETAIRRSNHDVGWIMNIAKPPFLSFVVGTTLSNHVVSSTLKGLQMLNKKLADSVEAVTKELDEEKFSRDVLCTTVRQQMSSNHEEVSKRQLCVQRWTQDLVDSLRKAIEAEEGMRSASQGSIIESISAFLRRFEEDIKGETGMVYSSAWALRQFGGSLRVGRSPNCFHVEPKDAAYGFLFNFYKHLNLVEPSRIASQLVFCRTEFGIFVGIGRKSNAKNDRHWKPTAYGFRIALSEGSPGDRADDVPEKSRKRSSYFQAGGGPLKLAKREEGSDASDGSVMSSHESPFSGLPLSGGGYLRRSDDETGEGSSTFGESDLSQPGVAFRAGTVIEEWEGKHVVPYGEAGNRVSPPIIPDAEYETLGTGLDNVWKITVNVRTDTETHQRWVGLRLDLGAYEWPVYFPEVTADSHEDCLYLDYSDQEHSGDLGLLGACIPFHPGPLVYPRICRDAGGGWSLRFNKTGSSGGTDGESPTPFTIDIKLHAVLPS